MQSGEFNPMSKHLTNDERAIFGQSFFALSRSERGLIPIVRRNGWALVDVEKEYKFYIRKHPMNIVQMPP